MFKNILIALAILAAAFAVVVAMQPADFRVVRSLSVDAPPEVVFAQVNDFHNWNAWSPWANLDPEMTQSFGGSPAGTGATYSWSGNDQVGEGRMTIIESRPPELVRINLEFLKPFAATNLTEFTFEPEGGQTAVTWTMSGRNSFIAKAFGLFVNMDQMIGGDFEKGLAQMKAVAEAQRDDAAMVE
jgi:hypothetical protein